MNKNISVTKNFDNLFINSKIISSDNTSYQILGQSIYPPKLGYLQKKIIPFCGTNPDTSTCPVTIFPDDIIINKNTTEDDILSKATNGGPSCNYSSKKGIKINTEITTNSPPNNIGITINQKLGLPTIPPFIQGNYLLPPKPVGINERRLDPINNGNYSLKYLFNTNYAYSQKMDKTRNITYLQNVGILL